MRAKIVVLANQKGGAGKTTLTMMLAAAFARAGGKVLVVDADKQASAQGWAAAAPDGKPFPAAVAGLLAAPGTLHREILKFASDYDLILVDCPPSVESTVPESAMGIADLVVIPLVPSPVDLASTYGIKEVVMRAMAVRQERNEQLHALLVVNMCPSRSKLARDVRTELESFGLPLATSRIGERTAFRQSFLDGCSVFELRDHKAREEVEALAVEIAKIISFPWKPHVEPQAA